MSEIVLLLLLSEKNNANESDISVDKCATIA